MKTYLVKCVDVKNNRFIQRNRVYIVYRKTSYTYSILNDDPKRTWLNGYAFSCFEEI